MTDGLRATTGMTEPRCRRCGAADLVPIVRGYPSPEMGAAAARGDLIIGGCMGGTTSHACRACGMGWSAAGQGIEAVERAAFDAGWLAAEHPPRLTHPNKVLVHSIAAAGPTPTGGIEYSRWRLTRLPRHLHQPLPDLLLPVPGWYRYAPLADGPADGVVEWHVNFADPELFGYYGGGLFAQDEVQVAEHPILASLREGLRARGMTVRTEVDGRPTPVLVRGAERRVAIATEPDPASGAPGLYGAAFGSATAEEIRRASRPIDPPTRTNVLAMAAPSGGRGRYTKGQIRQLLTTAYLGFAAAVRESEIAGGWSARIHTGYWGGGAFGGNRELLALVQLIAAQTAGVERLVFWTGRPGGERPLEAALEALPGIVQRRRMQVESVVDAIAASGYRWGASDGN